MSLLLVGLAVLAGAVTLPHAPAAPRRREILTVAALLLPLYVAFQLVPLPLGVVRVLSPMRAEIADALQAIGSAPTVATLTISAPTTWAFLWRTVGYVLIFLLARQIAARTSRRFVPTLPLLLFGAVETALVIAQYAAGETVRPGSYFNKDHLAGLLEMVLPLAVAYGAAVLHRARRAGHLSGPDALAAGVQLATAAAIFAAITFSLSRAGLLSALGSLVVMGALASGAARLGPWRWPLLAAVVLGVGAIFVFVIPDDLVTHLGRLASGADSDGRSAIWRDTVPLIGDYPLFGVGLGSFYPAILRYQTSGFDVAWTATHNDYLQQLSELGVIGAALPAIVLGGAFIAAARAADSSREAEARWFAVGCAGSLSAILIHSAFDFNTYVLSNAMVLAWVAGLAASTRAVAPGPVGDRAPARPAMVAAALLGGGLVLTAGAATWLVFLTSYHDQPSAEQAFCRVGFCDTEAVSETLRGPARDVEPQAFPLEHLVDFLHRDPAMPARWEALADALQSAGRTDEAEAAIARTLELDRSPQTLLNAAAFSFQVGQRERGLELMSRGLQGASPTDLTLAFSSALLFRVPVAEVLRRGLPDPPAAQAYLQWLIAMDRPAGAAAAWAWLLPRGDLNQSVANAYTEFLLQHEQAEAAAQAWAGFVAGRTADYPTPNRLFNGDFEQDPSGNRFDWRIEKRAGVTTAFDAAIRQAGTRSLRVEFDGTENVAEVGVQQWTYLAPGRYLFRAHVRTDALSTDQGVAFRIVHDQAPALNVTTEAVRGSRDWTVVEQVIEAPSTGGLVRVMLVRRPSLRFDNLISGIAWIDQVSLTTLPYGEASIAPTRR